MLWFWAWALLDTSESLSGWEVWVRQGSLGAILLLVYPEKSEEQAPAAALPVEAGAAIVVSQLRSGLAEANVWSEQGSSLK